MTDKKWIIKVALSKPALLKELTDVGYIEDDKTEKVLSVAYKHYKKNSELPSLEWIKTKVSPEYTDSINTIDVNESDIDVFHKTIEDFTKETFLIDFTDNFANKEFDFADIKKCYKENVKEYTEKVEKHKHLSNAQDIISLLKEYDEQEERYIDTGYAAINKVLKNKGWKPGSTYCVMGLTGTGKSIFLTNFAAKLLKQYNVLFITTEMGYLDTYERILYSYFDLGDKKSIAAKVKHGHAKINHNIDVYKVHPNDTTTDDIANIIDELDWKPEAIIIDYADEIKATEKSNNDYDKHGIVSADIKKLAEVYECPVITATQTNRQAEGEYGGTKSYIGMNAISDSQKKVRTLDVLFSIIQEPQEKEDGKIGLQVIKNRFGASQVFIEFTINYKHWRISDDLITQRYKEPKPKQKSWKNKDDMDKEELNNNAKKVGMMTLEELQNRRGKI